MIKLSGRIRYRQNWRGKVILQVEEIGTQPELWGGCIEMRDCQRWRDARMTDLTTAMFNPTTNMVSK